MALENQVGRTDQWRRDGHLNLQCTENFRSLDQVLGNGAAFDGREAGVGVLTATGVPANSW